MLRIGRGQRLVTLIDRLRNVLTALRIGRGQRLVTLTRVHTAGHDKLRIGRGQRFVTLPAVPDRNGRPLRIGRGQRLVTLVPSGGLSPASCGSASGRDWLTLDVFREAVILVADWPRAEIGYTIRRSVTARSPVADWPRAEIGYTLADRKRRINCWDWPRAEIGYTMHGRRQPFALRIGRGQRLVTLNLLMCLTEPTPLVADWPRAEIGYTPFCA